MDLILWRHAEAQDLTGEMADIDRALTQRGRKQASRMAAWLDRQLPENTRILCSPAVRTEQTALALGRKYRLQDELRPGASPEKLLTLAGWPGSSNPMLIVGHQPTLGEAVARLLGISAGECAIKKGAVWWLRSRVREGRAQTLLVTVQSADML